MAQPKVEKLITAVDIGSWKVSALIAGRTDTGELAILGTGQRESRGVRRGFIADMERTELAVRETVEQAERVAGTNIEDGFRGYLRDVRKPCGRHFCEIELIVKRIKVIGIVVVTLDACVVHVDSCLCDKAIVRKTFLL